jgi:hypothetical protein
MLGVADFFRPSNRSASEKKGAKEEAANAHADRVAGDRAEYEQQRRGNQVGL